ncbi:MAG TPA: lamin tail domain-containing protein, partial [Cytophagaceae bacterium]|nr:lamin tail domain-containing protein [Cytophagaceae bacterium]
MVHFSASSQVNDLFSDNDFTNNPTWEGEATFFTVNATSQLQSNGPKASSQLHLSTANSRCRDTEWSFYTKLDLDITTTNWARIYLVSDRADTENNPKGYYVKFDGTTNSVDLYKQDSITHTKIISGKRGRAGKKALNIFRIKVLCDPKGNWFLFSDSTATGNNFVKEGAAFDTTFSTSSYFGVYFSHTSTKRLKFYFDDLSIQQAPLSLLSAKAISSTTVDVVFNKEVNQASAENETNYSLSDGTIIGVAVLDSKAKNTVHLILSTALNTYTNYSISATTIFDTSLNAISFLNTSSFLYRVEAGYGDLVFSELFPDPSPQNGLPEYEFVEIFNRKNDTINLKDFIFSDGSTNGIFPSYKLPPHQYLVVCNSSNASQFAAYHPVLGLSAFPSLNNSGDDLTLKNQDRKLLHEVSYRDSWYADNDKKEGGWSLEIIDLNNPCGENSNWIASVDPSGGTPGKTNSVAASKPDLSPPNLLNAFIIDSVHIQLVLDEKPDANFISIQQFELTKGFTIQKVSILSSSFMSLLLEVSENFKAGEIYELSFSGVRDCNGNILIQQKPLTLVLPQLSEKGDVILNEILFNPRVGGYDFVELYNRSDKYLDLKNWQFANTDNGIAANKKIISS